MIKLSRLKADSLVMLGLSCTPFNRLCIKEHLSSPKAHDKKKVLESYFPDRLKDDIR